MVAYCCVYGCSVQYTKGGRFTFHRFPKEESLRKTWIENMKMENFKVSQYTTICSKHFEDDCFDTEKFGGTWLKPYAVPTKFDFQTHLLQKAPTTSKTTNAAWMKKMREKRLKESPNFKETERKQFSELKKNKRETVNEKDKQDRRKKDRDRKRLHRAKERLSKGKSIKGFGTLMDEDFALQVQKLLNEENLLNTSCLSKKRSPKPHKMIEQNRRFRVATHLNALRRLIPNMGHWRTTTRKLLKTATIYVQNLQETEKVHLVDKKFLAHVHLTLQQRLFNLKADLGLLQQDSIDENNYVAHTVDDKTTVHTSGMNVTLFIAQNETLPLQGYTGLPVTTSQSLLKNEHSRNVWPSHDESNFPHTESHTSPELRDSDFSAESNISLDEEALSSTGPPQLLDSSPDMQAVDESDNEIKLKEPAKKTNSVALHNKKLCQMTLRHQRLRNANLRLKKEKLKCQESWQKQLHQVTTSYRRLQEINLRQKKENEFLRTVISHMKEGKTMNDDDLLLLSLQLYPQKDSNCAVVQNETACEVDIAES